MKRHACRTGGAAGRETGALLVELMIALTVLVVGLLGFFTSFTSNFRATQDVTERDEVRVALENLTEILRTSNFPEIYNNYNGALLEIPYLKGSDGNNATVRVSCCVNETAMPAEFGPILDIDGSGGLDNPDCSADYKLLPVRLTLSYQTRYGVETRDIYIVLRE